MSFSCLNFSLHSPSYLATHSNSRRIGILDIGNVDGEATMTKCCTMQLFVERKLPAAFKRAGAGSRRTRFCIGNRIKNELQPRVKCTDSRDSTTVSIPQEVGVVSLNKEEKVDLDDGNGGSSYSSGSSGNGKFPPGGGGGGGDGGGNRDGKMDDNGEEHEFGPLLKYDDIVKEVEARGTSLPAGSRHARGCKKYRDPKSSSRSIFGHAGVCLASRSCDEVLFNLPVLVQSWN